MNDHRFALKLLVIVATIVLVGFTAEFLYDFSQARDPATGKPLAFSDLQVTSPMIRAVASPFARAYNNTLALILTFIGIAIPITANMYTPKLIEIFVRDKINLIVLCLYAILTAHSILSVTLSFDKYAGQIPFWVGFCGAIFGWTILLPYYFYVLSFLNPVKIIALVEKQINDEFQTIARSGESSVQAQQRLNQKILHLGSVLLKAVDRADRDVSLDAVRAHMNLIKQFHDVKARINPAFFRASDEITVGMSRAAVTIMSEAKIWVEQKIMNQVILAFNAALGKMPDGVSTICDSVKDCADQMAKREPEVLDLMVRCMNTFLKEAIKKKDVFSIYNVFYNYKSLCRKLMDDSPGKVPGLARYIRYYSDFSKQQGMPFIYELGSYELADVTEFAYEQKIPQAKDVLDVVLSFEGIASSGRLVKSRAILGAYFLQRGMKEELHRVTASFAQVPPPLLDAAKKELLSAQERIFWEVTDRGTNFDFVEDDRKEKVKELFEQLAAAATPGAGEKAGMTPLPAPAAAGAKG